MFNIAMLKEKYLITYGLNEDEIKRINLGFNGICAKPCKVISENMGNYKLSNIIGEEEIEVEDRQLPKEKIVIFNGFQGAPLQMGVIKVRKIIGSQAILASTTQNSVKMPLHELMDHLTAERNFFDKNKR